MDDWNPFLTKTNYPGNRGAPKSHRVTNTLLQRNREACLF